MTTLKDKIKLALNESRMLVLGAQIFLGFALRGIFEPAFERLPKSSQNIKLASLLVLLATIACLMAPGSYHRIVRGGSDAEDVHEFATRVMDVALVPFVIALVLEVYVMTGKILGVAGGLWLAALIGGLGAFFWYGLGAINRRSRKDTTRKERNPAVEPTKLKDKIDQALTEALVVLPGVQTLLGFQFITMFMDAFEKLPNSLKYLHMAGLGLMAVTMILLMTPAAFHRIAENGEATERLHAIASGFLLASMITLPLGICTDVFIVFRKVTGSTELSTAAAAAVLIVFYGLWFGFTTYRRTRLAKS
jgi:Family of unknown function (DUF6328)